MLARGQRGDRLAGDVGLGLVQVVGVSRAGGVALVGVCRWLSRSLRPRSERQRLEVVGTSVVENRLGALPGAAEFLRRLDIAGIVDEVCPGGASAHLTHQYASGHFSF